MFNTALSLPLLRHLTLGSVPESLLSFQAVWSLNFIIKKNTLHCKKEWEKERKIKGKERKGKVNKTAHDNKERKNRLATKDKMK
jgi:hypothetical protein